MGMGFPERPASEMMVGTEGSRMTPGGTSRANAHSNSRRALFTVTSFGLGLIAAPLPARWRRAVPGLEESAHADAAIPSALIQFVGCLVATGLAYVAWFNGQFDAIDAAAAAQGDSGRWNSEEHAILGRALLHGNPILPFVFIFTSPLGFSLATAAISGLIRLLHGIITRDPMPDPVLGLVDHGIARLRGRMKERERENSKDSSPDRLIIGTKADGYALAIETSKDLDWREGNTIVVASVWYRLKSKAEMTTPAGLRLRYVLEEMPIGVAVRGMRKYDPGHAPIVVSGDG